MLVAKVYGLLWLAVVGLTTWLLVTGSLTSAAVMVLGFIALVLVGAGMLVVYPVMMNEDVAAQRETVK